MSPEARELENAQMFVADTAAEFVDGDVTIETLSVAARVRRSGRRRSGGACERELAFSLKRSTNMKINNSTKWSTDDLRAIISAALSARGVPSTGLVVHVVPSKQWITGRATIGKMCNVYGGKKMYYGRWMLLRIPNPAHIAKHVETEEAKDHVLGKRRLIFARVVEHEVAHLQGLRHHQMSDALYRCTQDVPWLGELALGEEVYPDEAAAEQKAAARSGRLEHAREKLKLASTREKRAATLRKKWERRVRALERTGES